MDETPHFKPQTRAVLRHLSTGSSLTPHQARSLFGIDRLGARIHELRKAGYPVTRDLVPVDTRHGVTHVARYRLEATGSEQSAAAPGS